MDARRKFGEYERSVKVARGAVTCDQACFFFERREKNTPRLNIREGGYDRRLEAQPRATLAS